MRRKRSLREELVEAATALTLEQKKMMMSHGNGDTMGDVTSFEKDNRDHETSPTLVEFDILLEEAHVDHTSTHRRATEEEQHNDLDNAPPQAELARKHGLRDDAGFWELFQAQVMSDMGPIIKIIPAPVKAFVGDQVRNLRPVLVGAKGAVGPHAGSPK